MLKLKKTYFFIFVLILGSCDQKPYGKGMNEMGGDSLAIFPLESSLLFVDTNANDQIALLLERDSANIFKYRIELLRKWRGLPNDYGVLRLQKIEADSIYFFEGGSSNCEVTIKIYHANGKFEFGKDYVKIERNCKDDSLDIEIDEFQKLLYK